VQQLVLPDRLRRLRRGRRVILAEPLRCVVARLEADARLAPAHLLDRLAREVRLLRHTDKLEDWLEPTLSDG